LRWGAQLLIVKGDLTQHSRRAEWAVIGDVLADLPVPVVIVQGNHEVRRGRPTEALAGLREHGLHLVDGVEVVDLPGLRVIAADTTVEGENHGQLADRQDAVAAHAKAADGAVLVCVHHHLERHRVSTFYPPGVPGPESRAFLRALRAANPRCLVVTGHTHRHRRHVWEGVTWSEVGSTKDYPGTWAGYVVHASGIRQVVHHVSDPSVQAWLERTRWAVGGVWGLWSPGRLSDRCFSVTW
ncbi:MAG: 3,5-cyclic-AMP phosphodiesterase, partial [Acidimicrobiaceae bacterium]